METGPEALTFDSIYLYKGTSGKVHLLNFDIFMFFKTGFTKRLKGST